jgi:hypothetical protein
VGNRNARLLADAARTFVFWYLALHTSEPGIARAQPGERVLAIGPRMEVVRLLPISLAISLAMFLAISLAISLATSLEP